MDQHTLEPDQEDKSCKTRDEKREHEIGGEQDNAELRVCEPFDLHGYAVFLGHGCCGLTLMVCDVFWWVGLVMFVSYDMFALAMPEVKSCCEMKSW